jgi:nicotinamidase-related amidase
MPDPVTSFRLDRTAFHIAIDMQLLFAEPTGWFVPWMTGVLPNVTRIAEHAPHRTLFTRFIPPRHPEEMQGAWQDYYRQWHGMTQARLDPRLLELADRSGVSARLPAFWTRTTIPRSRAPPCTRIARPRD